MIRLEHSSVGPVVERTTRFMMLVHLPCDEGYRHKEALRDGPALGGYGAITTKGALAATTSRLSAQLSRSLAWDCDKEMPAHAQFTVPTGIPVFFADPQSPWQRGTNENTNGLLRQHFPKGIDRSADRLRKSKLSLTCSTSGPARRSAAIHQPGPSANNHRCSR